jgi:DNA-binding NarL/FixJ family response regulator
VIRVFLVDDQTLVRKGVRSLLSLLPDMEVAGEAADGAEALDMIPQVAPDVVLLDIRMPGLDGISVLRQLAPTEACRFIVLTTFDDADALFEGCRAGASGFLLKDVSLEQLAATIRAVAEGRTVLQPSITETLLRNLQMSDSATYEDDLEPLSEREREVIRLMAGGFSNREIGEMLSLSTGTVKNHVSRLLLKLDARDRTSAVLKAIASRLA